MIRDDNTIDIFFRQNDKQHIQAISFEEHTKPLNAMPWFDIAFAAYHAGIGHSYPNLTARNVSARKLGVSDEASLRCGENRVALFSHLPLLANHLPTRKVAVNDRKESVKINIGVATFAAFRLLSLFIGRQAAGRENGPFSVFRGKRRPGPILRKNSSGEAKQKRRTKRSL